MRNQFADTFYQLGKNDNRLVIVVADISPAGSIAKFREEFPDRFINTGVCEQIMIGMAAGMALRGLRPFAYTIATFALYRPFEFVRVDLAYQELPVTVVGMGSGVVYSTLGGTHHAMEDIAIACAIPGMQVLTPCDPAETALITRWCATRNQKPAYLRLGKTNEPDLTQQAEPFVLGKLRYLRRGKDICFISYGPILQKVLARADALTQQGKSCSVIACHCIKPLDYEGLKVAFASHDKVIVLEEHVPQGGLAMQVKAFAGECHARCEIVCHTLQDRFIHLYGSHDELLQAHNPELVA